MICLEEINGTSLEWVKIHISFQAFFFHVNFFNFFSFPSFIPFPALTVKRQLPCLSLLLTKEPKPY